MRTFKFGKGYVRKTYQLNDRKFLRDWIRNGAKYDTVFVTATQINHGIGYVLSCDVDHPVRNNIFVDYDDIL